MAYIGDLAAALLILRTARGLSQRELVRKTPNMTQVMLSGYECARHAPKLPNLRAILRALDFTLADLEAVLAFLRTLGGEPPAEAKEQRLRGEVVGAALRLAAGLVALAGSADPK